MAALYFVIRYLYVQFFGSDQNDEVCKRISDVFFGWSAIFVGFFVVLAWITTSAIAPSMLNLLRPDMTWWSRGLAAAGICVVVTVLIIVVFGGILTFGQMG